MQSMLGLVAAMGGTIADVAITRVMDLIMAVPSLVLLAWLQLRRWVNVLIGDIRGKRFLDNAKSPRSSLPILTQVRQVLAEARRGAIRGMGRDGADGLDAVRKAGGYTIAESEQTAVVYGMPREAALRGGVSLQLPSYQVAGEIVKAVRRTMA